MSLVQRVVFEGSLGDPLAARIDLPPGSIRGYALFAHCFTCSKDVFAASRISAELASRGIAVLRFDFTGLGASGGDFANTTFSSNVQDIVKAADFLRENHQAPGLLIGHSLGGAAVLMAASQIPEAKAVATIGAPADVDHVLAQFGENLETIEKTGAAEVVLAGRSFRIRRDFVDDARAQKIRASVTALKKALLVLHSPTDSIVGIDQARAIFELARHPKSFISLDGADHLLTSKADAAFVAEMISGWAARYLDGDAFLEDVEEANGVVVAESGQGRFQQVVRIGRHNLLADEPTNVGGDGSGPTPYDLLAAALGACTSMTLRMYAERKKIALGRISVRVTHTKTYAADCDNCVEGRQGSLSHFDRVITFDRPAQGDAMRSRLLEIADRCPVHLTLTQSSQVTTTIVDQIPVHRFEGVPTILAEDGHSQ